MTSNYFSKLKGAIWIGIQRSIYVKESGIDVLIGQGRFSLSSSRLLHSLPSETFTDLLAIVRPGTLAAVQGNLHVVNRRKNISVLGAFSRAISLPSVSGPSFQVCGYQVDCLLSEPSSNLSTKSSKAIISVCGTRSALANYSFTNLTSRPAQAGWAALCSFSTSSRRNFDCDRRVSMSLSDKYQPSNFLFYGYFVYNVAKQKGNGIPFSGLDFEGLHTLPPACFPAGTASDVSFQNTETDGLNSSSSDSNETNIVNDRILKLTSGSCYLPHPEKEDTGGEDAHFICTDEQAIGVADGVGGWADLGVNAGLYARELMSNSVNAIQEEPKCCIDPARVLEKAYTSTNAKGSSTACIIALTDEGLHAVNLGDSGFMVVRDGCTVFRSPIQQHDFNFTYQLESCNAGDLPSSGEVFIIPVAPGDVIIAGTDGLFDNLYNHEITAVVVHALRANLGPQVTAQKIAALARQRALDKNRQTPFSTAAQEAGFRYYGGKLDDITVVVSYITSDHNENLSANSSQ